MGKTHKKYKGGKPEPSLQPMVMKAPKYGTNYRQSAVMSQIKEAQQHNAMIGGEGQHVIPTIHTGVKPTIMGESALIGTANSTLQIQANGAYDEFDPSKPEPVTVGGGKKYNRKHTRKHKYRKSKNKNHGKKQTSSKRKHSCVLSNRRKKYKKRTMKKKNYRKN